MSFAMFRNSCIGAASTNAVSVCSSGLNCRPVALAEHRNVGLVQGDALTVALQVECGKRIHLQKHKSLDCRNAYLNLFKLVSGRVMVVNEAKKRVFRETHIDAQAFEMAPGKVSVLIGQHQLGELRKCTGGKNKINVLGVAALDVAKKSNPANKEIRNSAIAKQREKLEHVARKLHFAGRVVACHGFAGPSIVAENSGGVEHLRNPSDRRVGAKCTRSHR